MTESPDDITNPEEGMVELDAMDVEIAQDMVNIFRGMPFRLEKK